MTSFYSEEELLSIGFKSYGINVLISRYARFYLSLIHISEPTRP